MTTGTNGPRFSVTDMWTEIRWQSARAGWHRSCNNPRRRKCAHCLFIEYLHSGTVSGPPRPERAFISRPTIVVGRLLEESSKAEVLGGSLAHVGLRWSRWRRRLARTRCFAGHARWPQAEPRCCRGGPLPDMSLHAPGDDIVGALDHQDRNSDVGRQLELAALTLPAVLDCREDHWHHPTQEDDGRPSGTRTILVLPPSWSLHPAAPALESRAPRGIATACRRARSRRQNRHFGSGTRRTERRHGCHRHVPKNARTADSRRIAESAVLRRLMKKSELTEVASALTEACGTYSGQLLFPAMVLMPPAGDTSRKGQLLFPPKGLTMPTLCAELLSGCTMSEAPPTTTAPARSIAARAEPRIFFMYSPSQSVFGRVIGAVPVMPAPSNRSATPRAYYTSHLHL